MSDSGPDERPRAVRLIFEYEGDHVRLVAQQRVDIAVTGFDVSPLSAPGHYVETRNADDRTLSRVPLRAGFDPSVEVFPEEPGGEIARVDVAEPRGALTVVVPAPEAADHVAIVRFRPGEPEAAHLAERATGPVPGQGEVVEIASFPLEAD
jgi:hypothetical protein